MGPHSDHGGDAFTYARHWEKEQRKFAEKDGAFDRAVYEKGISERIDAITDTMLKRQGEADGKSATTKNPKCAAATTRLDLTAFPMTALIYGALGCTEGMKYGFFNYRVANVAASVYVAAALRHLTKWYNGEEADSTTKVPHLASVLACIAILVDAHEQGSLNDDRPPANTKVPMLLARFEQVVQHLQGMTPNAVPRYTQKQREPAAALGQVWQTGMPETEREQTREFQAETLRPQSQLNRGWMDGAGSAKPTERWANGSYQGFPLRG